MNSKWKTENSNSFLSSPSFQITVLQLMFFVQQNKCKLIALRIIAEYSQHQIQSGQAINSNVANETKRWDMEKHLSWFSARRESAFNLIKLFLVYSYLLGNKENILKRNIKRCNGTMSSMVKNDWMIEVSPHRENTQQYFLYQQEKLSFTFVKWCFTSRLKQTWKPRALQDVCQMVGNLLNAIKETLR